MDEQIKKLMDVKNLSATQFSDEIGIQRSSLSHVLSGRNKPSLDFMIKIKSRFPEINLDWLLMGTGKMIEQKIPEHKEIEKVKKNETTENSSDVGLFSELDEQVDQLGKNYETLAKSENEPVYSRKTPEPGKKTPEKVIILYSDKTFSVYTQKG